MIEILGYVSTLILVSSSIPQLITTLRTKQVQGLSVLMLWLWFLGCFGLFWYVYLTSFQLPLLFNYGFTATVSFWLVLLYYRYK